MKRIYKMFMAVAAVAAVGCTTDATEDLGVKVGGQTTLTLSLDDTRTQLGDKADGIYPLTWAEGDAISVNGYASKALTANEAGAASATFTFENGYGSAPYFVAYPAVEGTTNQVVFAAEQTHVSNTSFGNNATVIYGYATELNSVKLNHLTGVLKIGLVSGTEGPAFIKEVRISTVDRKPIAGAFNVDAEGKFTATEGATEVITYKSESDAGFLLLPAAENNPVTYIHVTVPAGVYGELYVTLESVDGVMYHTITTDSTKPVNAGTVREISSNIVFVPVAETETFVIADYSDLYEFKGAVEGGSNLDAVLVNDIQLPAANDVQLPAWEPINAPNYTGTINGNGFAIKGLYAPLFNVTAASFKGLHLVANVEEKVNPNFGAFARQLVANGNAPKIEHCSVSGTIAINTNIAPAKADVLEDGATGGFVGIASGVHFENCVNNAALELKQYSSTVKMWGIMGGFVGMANAANEIFTSFTNCTNKGALTYSDTTGMTPVDFGGIVGLYTGYKATVVFDNCSNYGDLTTTESSSCRDCNIGGIIAIVEGTKDGSDNTNRKNITFTNTTTNDCKIEVNGTIASTARIGGLIGYKTVFCTTEITGTSSNNGYISLTKKAKTIYIGGYIGAITGGCIFNINNFATNNASISVTGESTEQTYLAGFVGYISNTNSNTTTERIQYKTVTNNGAITFSGTSGTNMYMGGFAGYTYNTSTYLNKNGKFINKATLSITEGAVIKTSTRMGGAAGYVNGNSFVAGSENNAQAVNEGTIIFAGDARGTLNIGGIYGGHWNNVGSNLEVISVGDIYATGKFDATQDVRVGGFIGRTGSSEKLTRTLSCKTQSFCNIVAYTITNNGDNYTFTPYPRVGMITGNTDEDMDKVTNVQLGGKIATTATVVDGVVTPTWVNLTADKYADYVFGDRDNLTSYAGASYLSSKDDIDWGNYGN